MLAQALEAQSKLAGDARDEALVQACKPEAGDAMDLRRCGAAARSWGCRSDREAPDLAENNEIGLAGAMVDERSSCKRERCVCEKESGRKKYEEEGPRERARWGRPEVEVAR